MCRFGGVLLAVSMFTVSSLAMAANGTINGPVLYLNSDGSTDGSDRSYQKTTDTSRIFTAEDCYQDRSLKYPMIATNWATDGSEGLEIWAGLNGVDCTIATNRSGSTQQCWRVSGVEYKSTGNQMYIPVRARDILSQNKSTSSYVAASESVCGTPVSQTYTLSFLFIKSGTASGPTAQVQVDSLGPDAPSNVSTTVGENRLLVGWTLPSNTGDVLGYKVYCADGTATEAIGTVSGDAGVTGVDASSALDASDLDAASEGGLGTLGGGDLSILTADAGLQESDAESSSSQRTCSASTYSGLVAGAIPPIDSKLPAGIWVCGHAGQVTAVSAQASTGRNGGSLQNGTTYWVAVAGYDKYGNIGKTSNVACGIPDEVTDFFETYRSAGGQGGCSLKSLPSSKDPSTIISICTLGAIGALFIMRSRLASRTQKPQKKEN